jgi:hypothetical protein
MKPAQVIAELQMAMVLKFISKAALAGLLVVALTTGGEARPDARRMSCAEAQALIDREGAVVLTTGDHTYQRYVSGTAECGHMNAAQQASISTRDDRQCTVQICGRRYVEPD